MKRSTMFALASRWGIALILSWMLVIMPMKAAFSRPAKGVGFALEKHDAAHSLATAPTVQWNTFMGGSSTDWSNDIAMDGNSNVYVVGLSYTTWGSPTNAYAGGQDAFVAQLNSNGVRQWNTFLGSASDDEGNGIAMDKSGNVYIVGSSGATWGSPINPFAGSRDVFVVKLNSNGALQWLTFLGGSDSDNGNGIAVDDSGNVYVVGTSVTTWGSPINPFPEGWQSPFVAKLNNSGALQWNTFWGAGSLDSGQGVAVDGSGNVYVVGDCYTTWGSPVNAYAGGSEACVAKLDTNGTRQWNTFLGSAGSDGGSGITVDENYNVYVTGRSVATWGTPLNPHGGSSYDVFVARLNGSDGVRQWNTFMGFSNTSNGYDVAADRAGNVYVVGKSKDAGTFSDAFLAQLNIDGFREWNIFVGYTYNHDYGYGVVTDGSGHVYIAGTSLASWGLPINSHSGGSDAFVARLDVPAQANAGVSKSANSSITTPGETITYALTFYNRGYLTATGVLITDTIPIALTNVNYTRRNVAITPTGSISYTWKVQDLTPGASGVITITGVVSPDLKPGTVLTNTAIITSTTVDSNPDNNSSSVWVTVTYRIFLPLVLKDY